MELSNRLQVIADLVPLDTACLADIGSDHAYLPIYLIQNNRVGKAIAGEVAPGPLQNSQKEVAQAGLSQVMEVRMGDGLSILQDEDPVDLITICGMGGNLITRILDQGLDLGKLPVQAKLILQANNGEPGLRKWLVDHHYQIDCELLVKDKGIIYTIILASKAQEAFNYSPIDLDYGFFDRTKPPQLAIEKWQKEFDKWSKILAQVQQSKGDQADRVKEVKEKVKQLEELLNHDQH